MKKYNHKTIEKKWQKVWESKNAYRASDESNLKNFYGLIEFPFPSGTGLHTGHIRSNTAMDIICRKRRMEGFNVLYPIGWDAFGLPTENYAIKTGIQPSVATKKNTDNFRKQLKSLGYSFDWDREINTTDPKYYKWTQWIFIQMFKAGLAYKARMAINWCPKDKIGLANEEVIDGKCERCGTIVEKKEKEQWMLAITKYADRLYEDLDLVDYLPQIKTQQRNWIGRSEGTEFEFNIKGSELKIDVFTTRADTIFGVTYVVISPESKLLNNLLSKIENKGEVESYIEDAKKKTEIERTEAKKEKTGVELKGIKAINPGNMEEVGVWVADYVLSDYGTGAVMAVPAHDNRDYAFAKKYNISIKEVIEPLVTKETGPDAFRKDMPISERRAMVAVIKHWEEDKYLGVEWKKTGWRGFIIGGIEEGEDAKVSGLREITEESGYKNPEYISSLGGIVHAQFYQMVKEQNRFAHFEPVLFKLKNDEMGKVDEKENELHKFLWLKPEEFKSFITHPDMQIIWDRVEGNYCFEREGILVNSGKFNGLNSKEARENITKDFGKKVVKYKLRDWVFSRQRYWGEPIPIINCSKCGLIPVSDDNLPVELPKVKHYEPTDTGESPLATITKWVNAKCPNCGENAKRETDTMPNWAGSSWYYLRYVDPKNNKEFADKEKIKNWIPVDWYNGGMEHTTLHLLYSRFWHKFLYDLKLVPTSEPYKKRTSHGFVLAKGGEKMSKSKDNVVNPDELIGLYGADSLRLYEMFIGPFDQAVSWSSDNIIGCRRFVERLWNLQEKLDSEPLEDKESEILLNQTIKKVSEDIEAMSFNTAISALMIFVNKLEKDTKIPTRVYKILLLLAAPFVPHITEEIWHALGNKESVHKESWPVFDAEKLVKDIINIAIQVNGKVRGEITIRSGQSSEEIINQAKQDESIKKWIENKTIVKEIYIPERLINIVLS